MSRRRTAFATDPSVTDIVVAGAHRGAEDGLLALVALHQSGGRTLRVHYVDPVRGRANILRVRATGHGLLAEAVEGTVETFLSTHRPTGTPLVLHLDRPEPIARALLEAENLHCPILGYLLVRLPTGQLIGLRFVAQPGDTEARRLGVHLFSRLGAMAARRGSAAVIGENGDPAHLASESIYRAWFAGHTESNLGKLVAGIEPDAAPFEMTDDGSTTQPLFIHVGETWSDPLQLAAALVENPPLPLLRGERFAIAEVTGEGIRFHRVHTRRFDGTVALDGTGLLDAGAIDRERLAQETATALARAGRQTITRRSSVVTTD